MVEGKNPIILFIIVVVQKKTTTTTTFYHQHHADATTYRIVQNGCFKDKIS